MKTEAQVQRALKALTNSPTLNIGAAMDPTIAIGHGSVLNVLAWVLDHEEFDRTNDALDRSITVAEEEIEEAGPFDPDDIAVIPLDDPEVLFCTLEALMGGDDG